MDRRRRAIEELQLAAERLLVLRFQAGDHAAFEDLARRYEDRLRFYLKKLAPRGASVEDLLQDVWLESLRGIRKLRDPGAFRTWLFRIARDRSAREFRSRPPPAPLEVEPAIEIEEAAFTAEELNHVRTRIDHLPVEQREALTLRYFEGLDYSAIAEVAGCPLGTIRSRLHQGKRALRVLLEENPE